MANQKQADIEIYVKDQTLDDIFAWLNTCFNAIDISKNKGKLAMVKCHTDNTSFDVEIVSEAVGKRFISLWFQSEQTPWHTDLDCAREAFEHFQTEIRCSEGDWTESEGLPEKQLWWRINQDGEKLVQWS